MAVLVATRLRALWLVCLLVLTPAGPLGLVLSGHMTSEDTHAAATVHDPTDHGISAGALGDVRPDRHCLYCRSASAGLRFRSIFAPLHRPASTGLNCKAALRDRIRAPHSRPAHPLPAPDRPSGRPLDHFSW